MNEAYLRLVDQRAEWSTRRHFYAIASTVMRRILIDRARKRRRTPMPLTVRSSDAVDDAVPVDVIDLDRALSKLEEKRPFDAEVVSLRYFAGLSIREVAETLDVGTTTVERSWSFSRLWLLRELKG